ncbi:GDSL-type esterase/lipase family protein [Geodermatophilus sp. SYSU D00867]
MRTLRAAAVALLLVLAGTGPAAAAPADRSTLPVDAPVMLVVDTSGSMAESDDEGTVKIEGAKTAILELLEELPPSSRIGMRTYPAGAGDCGTGHLDVDVAQRDPRAMSAVVRALRADGGTPTAEALQAAADDVRDAGFGAATIVLVSDGESTCDPPCPVAQRLVDEGFDLTVNTVGFRIDDAGADELRCIADATGGTYTDVRDSAELGERLAATQAPRLTLDVDAPATYSPSSSAAITATATVANDSAVLARDVRASLVFDPGADGGSPTVLRPLRVLGNVAAGGTTTVSWTAYPSLDGGGGPTQFDWTLRVSGAQVRPQQQSGSISVREFSLADAAPWLQDTRHAVVLGDSYSSGEGAGDYDRGAGRCHRSPHTYAEQLLPDAEVTNLACSAAVIQDYREPQADRDVRSQAAQLDDVDDYDLVLMTMGGNDIGFEDIVVDCAAEEHCGGRLGDRGWWTQRLADLQTDLRHLYEEVLADTGVAPLVVLPYVGVVPTGAVGTGCSGTTATVYGVKSLRFDEDELRSVQWLLGALNGAIEGAVRAVGDSRLQYAADVVEAVRPAHTICSEDRWIVGLPDRGSNALSGLAAEAKQELVHPTADGYRAIAAALARWSHSVPDPREGARPREHHHTWVDGVARLYDDWLAQDGSVDLQDGADPFTVDPGAELRVRSGGYEPNTPVLVVVRSTAQTLASVWSDDRGAVDVVVTVPRTLAPGDDHTLTVSGTAADGTPLERSVGMTVGSPPLTPGLLLAGLGLVLAATGALVVRRALRRRRAD